MTSEPERDMSRTQGHEDLYRPPTASEVIFYLIVVATYYPIYWLRKHVRATYDKYRYEKPDTEYVVCLNCGEIQTGSANDYCTECGYSATREYP